MGICRFKTSEVLRCVEHALAGTVGRTPKEPYVPSLYFVHDSGVYVMSGSNPPDIVRGGDEPSSKCYVAYAKGCDPDIDKDYYETSRVLVGGDDFGEAMEIEPDWVELCRLYKEMFVKVSDKDLVVGFAKPINASVKRKDGST